MSQLPDGPPPPPPPPAPHPASFSPQRGEAPDTAPVVIPPRPQAPLSLPADTPPLGIPMSYPAAGLRPATHNYADEMTAPQPRIGTRVLAGILAALAAIGAHLTWVFFVTTETGQRLDELAFTGSHRSQPRLWALLEPVLNVISVAFIILAVLAVMVLAAVRRRWVLAIQVAVMIGGANLTTQLLKDVFYHRPNLLPGPAWHNSLPSGHTTVAASLTMALLLACPRFWRPVVAVLGVGWTSLTGIATMVDQWHRPSDVVASVLVALAWAAVVCAFTSPASLDAASPS
ncbi:MAG: phosphatase PAP2 family protein, partial [Promicromonosporaceae bacterium]|nr:phosphatase PAP2 family protein [Promicromonosporaceae bacterium]